MIRLFRRNVRVTVFPVAPAAQPGPDAAASAAFSRALAQGTLLAGAGLGTEQLLLSTALAQARTAVASPQQQQYTRPSGDTTVISDLRIQFKVEKSVAKPPNQCDITITNLARGSRVAFERRPLAVVVEAGYDRAFRHMFSGDVLFSMSEIKGPDWETLLQVGEGDRAYNLARVNRTYPRGTNVLDAVHDVVKQMGFQIPSNIEASDLLKGQFATGAVVIGAARDELTRLLAPFGYTWSMQNGGIQILRDDDAAGNQAHVISESTGMIGTPEFGAPPRSGKPPHVKVKCLMYPELAPGGLVKVISKSISSGSGLYRIEKLTHRGDTHGSGDSSWVTELEVKPYTPGDGEHITDIVITAETLDALDLIPGGLGVAHALEGTPGLPED